MRIYLNQRLASTNLDSQNERVPLSVLESFAAKFKNKKQILHQSHDFSKPSPGHVENIHIIEEGGVYYLRGDVHCDESLLEEVMRGYSISYTKMIQRSVTTHDFIVYLPYPHYNDNSLIQELSEGNKTSVGKFVKKAAGPDSVAVVFSAVLFLLSPLWSDIYHRKIAPTVHNFIKANLEKFQSKGITFNFIQKFRYQDHEIEVLLTPERGNEEDCLSEENISAALGRAHAKIYSDNDAEQIERICMYFPSQSKGFVVHRIEYLGGRVVHYTDN